MNKWDSLWLELGIDLDSHQQLMNVLSEGYQSIFLTQENRPEKMDYFNFVVSEIHGARINELQEARKAGKKVVGSFCTFIPEELILALDAVSVGLCSGAELGFDLAEQYLPRNTCSLIKSAFGFKLAKVCPYFEASDLVIGENTCDGKKKSFERLGELCNTYALDLPQNKSEAGKQLFHSEIYKLITKLEELTGNKLTQEKLAEAIKIVNAKRAAVIRLATLRAADAAPISGLDVLLISQIFFNDDPVRFTAKVNELCDELEERIKNKISVFPANTPRILVSGCPMSVPNWKIPALIESSGAVIIGEELCTGERGWRWLTEESGNSTDELINNIVERYFQIDCAVFTPNESRYNSIKEMAKKYKADGVLIYNLQFCNPYIHEDMNFTDKLEDDGIPVLNIETDYSQEDAGQLSTRIQAFIERLS